MAKGRQGNKMDESFFKELLNISLQMAQTRVLEPLLEYAMRAALELVGAEYGHLVLRQADGGLDFRVSLDRQGQKIAAPETQISRSILDKVISHNEPLVVFDALGDASLSDASSVAFLRLRSVMCVPLTTYRQTLGAIYVENRSEVAIFEDEDLEPLNFFATQAAVFIENAMLNDDLEAQVRARTAELREAKDAAEAANRAKSDFLANMSHELRTPLNAILGFSELMQRAPGLTPDQRKNLETIGRSGEHLLALINDVLELSKIERGHLVLQEGDFDLHHMLLGLEEMFHLRTRAKGLTLTFERAPDVPQYVRADQNKLRQVLINLLGNAVKFTSQGGVTLRVGIVDSGQGAVSSETDPYPPITIHFEVQDTGAGIAPEEMDTVFDAFVQTASGRLSQQGTGLGMPISREFVRVMGGTLNVSSEVDQGTTFQFDVRAAIVDVSQSPALPDSRRVVGLEPEQPLYRLLVADDVSAGRKLLVKLLRPLGFEVRQAANGQEVLEIWQTWRPHLIWMDVRMPVMDGHQVTERIRAACRDDASHPTPVIIALTASAFEQDREKALAVGCDDFVRKPFREADIFDALARHLGVRFLYEETERGEREERAGQISTETLVGALAALPLGWLVELKRATIDGDIEWIATLLERIEARDTRLAGALNDLAYDFRYDEMLTLVQQAQQEPVGRIGDE
jgi:signal transduction histidine kinase/FixJ family two-component response regulator